MTWTGDRALPAAGINPGYRLSGDELLVAITEQRTRAHIDLLADTIAEALA